MSIAVCQSVLFFGKKNRSSLKLQQANLPKVWPYEINAEKPISIQDNQLSALATLSLNDFISSI